MALSLITQNIVYDYPIIRSLAHFIASVANCPSDVKDASNEHAGAIRAMIQKYSADLSFARPVTSSVSPEGGAVVLLTGSTGNIGSEILLLLLQDNAVHHIHCLNRPSHSSHTVLQRHEARFKDKGHVSTCILLQSSKVTFWEGSTDKVNLGLDDIAYSKVTRQLYFVDGYADVLFSSKIVLHISFRENGESTLISISRPSRVIFEALAISWTSPALENIPPVFASFLFRLLPRASHGIILLVHIPRSSFKTLTMHLVGDTANLNTSRRR